MAKNREARLIWKPTATLGASLFFLAFGSLALVFLFFYPEKGLLDWLLFITYCFWTGGALFGTLYGLRTRVEANENGVRWRDWRGVWRAAKWDEISDFHRRTIKNENGSTHRVETAQGDFDFGLEGDGKAIAQLIAERALNAPVRDWEIKGERLADTWPRRFEFASPGRNNASILALVVLLATFSWVAWLLLRLPARGDLSFGVWFLAYVGPILMLPVFPVLIWLSILIQARQARPFRGQSVEISPEKLVFQGANRIEATWTQFEAVNWIKRGRIQFLQLQTAGGTIEVPSFIGGFRSLCRILEQFSGVALIKPGGEAEMAVVPIQTAPDGELIFSFYESGARILIWILSPLGCVMLLMPFLMRSADPETPVRDSTSVFVMGIAVTLLSLALHWWLKNARLHLKRDFLEWRAPFFRRFVAWQDIEGFGNTTGNSGWIEVAGQKIPLIIFWFSIAQRSRLHAEIEKRAFNAKGSWQ